MNPKTTKEYRAHVTLNNATISITCSDLRQLHDMVETLHGQQQQGQHGRLGFAPANPNDTSSTSFIQSDGNNIGWIAQYEVPFNMSVGSLAQSRLQRVA